MASNIGYWLDIGISLLGSFFIIAAYFGFFVKPAASDEELLDDKPKPNKLKGNWKTLLLGIGLLIITLIRMTFLR